MALSTMRAFRVTAIKPTAVGDRRRPPTPRVAKSTMLWGCYSSLLYPTGIAPHNGKKCETLLLQWRGSMRRSCCTPGHDTGGLKHRLAYDFMLENICYLIIHVVIAVIYDNSRRWHIRNGLHLHLPNCAPSAKTKGSRILRDRTHRPSRHWSDRSTEVRGARGDADRPMEKKMLHGDSLLFANPKDSSRQTSVDTNMARSCTGRVNRGIARMVGRWWYLLYPWGLEFEC
jgi:hypothetical protein